MTEAFPVHNREPYVRVSQSFTIQMTQHDQVTILNTYSWIVTETQLKKIIITMDLSFSVIKTYRRRCVRLFKLPLIVAGVSEVVL